VDDGILGDRARNVLEKYRGKSYSDAAVTWKITVVDEQEGLADVKLTVSEGMRASVRHVVFEGNRSVSKADLRPTLQPPSWWNVTRWFSLDRYERDNVEMAQMRIRDLYLDRGFLEVEVDPPLIKKDEVGRLIITYKIQEGQQYRFGTLSIAGSKLFPESTLAKTAPVRPNALASQSKVDEGRRGIEDYYGSRGYIDTLARPVLKPDRARGIADLVYEVKEGAQVHIRNILIRGNSRTREKVVRRELLVHPGEIYDQVKVRRSERIVENLGYFGGVRADNLATMNPGERDLLFEVEEKNTGQFHIGAGFSSIDKIIGFAELSQGNFDLFGWPYFTGGGQKLRLRTEYGANRKEYSLDFTEPWFLDRKLAFNYDVARSEVNNDDYDVKRTGTGVSLSRALPASSRVKLGYRIEKWEITDVTDTNRYVYIDPPQDDFYFTKDENRIESSLRLTLSHDTRDRPFIPTRGNISSVFGQVTGGPMGFDTDYYYVGLSAGQYLPLWLGHVLYLRARAEVVEEFGDTEDVPLADRLFAGGGRTIRGYDYRGVGPKVVPAAPTSTSASYRSAGGRTLFVAKADYTVPVISAIRLATFFDIGNVWRDAYDFKPDQMASSFGVGIRLDLPGFPISVDRAWPVRKDNEITKEDAWVFWIGYDF
jgi:outer membrane protein insertion porin family